MSAAAPEGSIYRRLRRRNRMVGLLRLGVPVLGVLVFLGLVVQIVISSFGDQFGIDRITVSPDAVTVDTPEYAGVFQDGSAFRVWSEAARAATATPDLIDLFDAHLVLDRIDGVQMSADAETAQLDTTGRLVLVPGIAEVANTAGTSGTLTDSVFDWDKQVLTANGPVDLGYPDGTTVRADGLVHDASTSVWTFTRAVVTLPSTPGEDLPPGAGEPTP